MDVFLDFRSLASSPDEATVAVDGESFGASRAILTQVLPSTVLAPSPRLPVLCMPCLQLRCAALRAACVFTMIATHFLLVY